MIGGVQVVVERVPEDVGAGRRPVQRADQTGGPGGAPDVGGRNLASRPMEVLLMGMAQPTPSFVREASTFCGVGSWISPARRPSASSTTGW